MPKTLLAVDDSATMRKVLEITFGGEDYRVVTADSSQSALGKMNEEPRVVVIDTALGSDDGYALSKEIRRRDGSAVIVLLSSRHNPYDQAKGADAGADDFMDKPFDTQQMADKVRKAVAAREAGAGPAFASKATQQGGVGPVAQVARPIAAAPPASVSPAPPPAAPMPPPPKPAAAGRANTLMFGGGDLKPPPTFQPAPPPAAAAPPPQPAAPVYAAPVRPAFSPQAAPPPPAQPAPVAARPVAPSPQPPRVAPAPAAAAAPTPAAGVSRATTRINGHMTDKLGELGLSQEQVEAVLALSRDVVERVVWEVVPELAEMLIKEEITRLTRA